MRALRLLLPVLIAMVFAASGLARAAPLPHAAAPPCHMAMADMEGGAAHAPGKAPPVTMADMSCCIACLAVEPSAPPSPAIVARALRPPAPLALASPEGETPEPNLGPPRTFA